MILIDMTISSGSLYITTQHPCSAAGMVVVEAAGFVFVFEAGGMVTETEPIKGEAITQL